MHVIFRETHGLDGGDSPRDLGQTPADLVVLSFSDSDLGAFAAGWQRADGGLPGLRLANLAALKHPLSVDTYLEQTLAGAKGILIRLIGGAQYWPYGLAQVEVLARRRGIALAVLPGDGRADARLDAASTLPVSTLRRLAALCDEGGAVAAQAALAQMALAAGLYAGPVAGEKRLPAMGFWQPGPGVVAEPAAAGRPLVLVSFYRAWLSAADTDPLERLMAALEARGFAALGVFVPSLKAPEVVDWLGLALARLAPVAIVNATAFSAAGEGGASVLDAAGVPVFQVALATSDRAAWAGADRGLSPADLAMHVVLPEVDGRIFAGVVSFKDAAPRDPALEFSRVAHRGDDTCITAAVVRVAAWVALAQKPAAARQVAFVLSTYPGKSYQMAHAVGLDTLASCEAMLDDLQGEGYAIAPGAPLVQALCCETVPWRLAEYEAALATLPPELRADLAATWGAPGDDPAVAGGAFHFAATRRGRALVALQPERGTPDRRDAEYHDMGRVPRHAYVAFYLWLRHVFGADALVHVGAHGTLEWLPGKSVALADTCWPEVLVGPLPVLYPFIVNDPGEAAQAKRRIAAITIGHLTPPLRDGAMPAQLSRLERLLDEYSTADGLDPARRDRLMATIRAEAQAAGVEADLGLPADASHAEAITRIDRFVCDVKESQFTEGLHVFGRLPAGMPFDAAPSAQAERQALLAGLAGRRVAPGPSGSPWRGRADVLPTGRNLYTTDPRAVPSRAAYAQGVKLAEELVRRHLQDHGDYPRGLVVDLWGSATMRTAGEEFAMALHLAGIAPRWDEGSDRVTGFEIVPLALMNRPRIDVTLRVSGLFRDVFPGLAELFEQAAARLAQRDEAPDFNPYAGQAGTVRVFAPRPGSYGLGMGAALEDYSVEGRDRAGEAWLAASDHSAAGQEARADLEARLAQADAFVHIQDLPESDLLLAADYAAHEGGFAAAMARLGANIPALYHMDATRPDQPRARALPEEIARVVRSRATNPVWLRGMMRHGFRGGAEIAATLDHLAAFAHLAGAVPAHLFDLYHDATLGDAGVRAFLAAENPDALAAMQARFQALHDAGLWRTRRNSIAADLQKGDVP